MQTGLRPHAKTKAPPVPPSRRLTTHAQDVTETVSDLRAKTMLKEAVDAVVDSFAKSPQGYSRGIDTLLRSRGSLFTLISF